MPPCSWDQEVSATSYYLTGAVRRGESGIASSLRGLQGKQTGGELRLEAEPFACFTRPAISQLVIQHSPPPARSEAAQFGGAAVLRLKVSSATDRCRAWIHVRVATEYVLLCSVRRASRVSIKRLLFAEVGLASDRSGPQHLGNLLSSLPLSLHQIGLIPVNYGGNTFPPTIIRYTARN